MNQRFLEESQKVRTLVKEGKLGEIYHAKAYWFRRSGIPKLGTWFGKKELAGGGEAYQRPLCRRNLYHRGSQDGRPL
ncbi:MAG: Gfo/Idh/MocA family protein [Planctomycetota bacterium]|jgi:predicted dehydrogenase